MADRAVREVTIGLAQITGAPYDAEANRELTLGAAGELFGRGAELVVLPELIVPGYVADREPLLEVAEPIDGPSVAAWRGLAAEHGGWIAAGFAERDGDELFNSVAVVGPDGLDLHYRKLHPFRDEKHAFAPGDLGLPTAELPFGRIGVCVCYDLRFVEVVRALALSGAELVLVPTAWVPGFDRQRRDADGFAPQARGALLQANLSQVFIVCASQAGSCGETEFLGSSLLCDPYGRPAAGPLPGTEDELALATVDLGAVEAAQTRDPLIRPRADRRTDVYGIVLDGRTL